MPPSAPLPPASQRLPHEVAALVDLMAAHGKGAGRLLRMVSFFVEGGLMVVANVDDSRVVLDIASDDDAITPSSSSST
uniref:Uncharacterized protein n=1 Tax=Zea mays TaxID=4577 RepID=A0A804N2C4_MAIZE